MLNTFFADQPGAWLLVSAEICIIAFIVNVVLIYFEFGNEVISLLSVVFLSVALGVGLNAGNDLIWGSLGVIGTAALLMILYKSLYDRLEDALLLSELRKCVLYDEYHVTGLTW
ncbi:hypothetical protein ACFL2R_03385 [Patescibacteria group bacterium]